MSRETQKALEILRWEPSDGRDFAGAAVASGASMRPIARVKRIAYASSKGREVAIWSHDTDAGAFPILGQGTGRGAFAPVYSAGETWLLLGRLTDLVIEGERGDVRVILPPLLLATTAACTTRNGGPLIFVAEGGTSFALCPVYNAKRGRLTPFVTRRGIEG